MVVAECSTDIECPSGWVCVNNRCYPTQESPDPTQPPEVFYGYFFEGEAETNDYISVLKLNDVSGTPQQFINDFRAEFQATAKAEIQRAFTEKFGEGSAGRPVALVEMLLVKDVWLEYLDNRPYVKLHCKYKYAVTSTVKLSESPFPTEIFVAVLKYILVALLLTWLAAQVIEAVKQWLIAMTTQTTEYERYEWVWNPNTEEWDWLRTESGTKTDPSLEGILGVGSIGIIIVILILIVVLPMLLGRRRD